jgi:hypothetical protein
VRPDVAGVFQLVDALAEHALVERENGGSGDDSGGGGGGRDNVPPPRSRTRSASRG